MKSTMLHERRKWTGLTRYGVLDAPVTPGILSPQMCPLGLGWTFFNVANAFYIKPSDYAVLTGYISFLNPKGLELRAFTGGDTIQFTSRNITNPVGAIAYARHQLFIPNMTGGSFADNFSLSFGKNITAPPTFTCAIAYQGGSGWQMVVWEGNTPFVTGLGLLPVGSTIIMTYSMQIGTLVSGTIYNYTATVTATTVAGVVLATLTRTNSVDLGIASNWAWQYRTTGQLNFTAFPWYLSDLYMVGSGLPNPCGGTTP